MMELGEQQEEHLQRMVAAGSDGQGFDIVIVSTSSPQQARYWQQRLEATRGSVLTRSATIAVLVEEWHGPAGNGLGTLYALQAAERDLPDLWQRLEQGASVALYHTAGKGTRIAPLGASEGNNKSSVKLPGLVQVDKELRPITLLESVLRQTSLLAAPRKGRLSVFWGDQLFLPSVGISPVGASGGDPWPQDAAAE